MEDDALLRFNRFKIILKKDSEHPPYANNKRNKTIQYQNKNDKHVKILTRNTNANFSC